MKTSLGLKAKTSYKYVYNLRYDIENVSKKDLSKIMRKVEKLPYEIYENKWPNLEPTDSCFCLSIQLAKYTMRADAPNSDNYPVRTETTSTKQIPTWHIFIHMRANSKSS